MSKMRHNFLKNSRKCLFGFVYEKWFEAIDALKMFKKSVLMFEVKPSLKCCSLRKKFLNANQKALNDRFEEFIESVIRLSHSVETFA